MNCMKCGRETVGDQVFCNECLADMEKYPVRPGTLVHLPHRREEPVQKKPASRRKAPPSPEEQVKSLKNRLRKLRLTVLILVLLLGVLVYFTVRHILNQEVSFLPGQNYSSMTTDENVPE